MSEEQTKTVVLNTKSLPMKRRLAMMAIWEIANIMRKLSQMEPLIKTALKWSNKISIFERPCTSAIAVCKTRLLKAKMSWIGSKNTSQTLATALWCSKLI